MPVRHATWPLYIGGFLGPFGGAVVATMLPEMAGDLGVSVNAASLSLTAYLVPFAVLMLAPALTAIPEEVETAAASLGAPWWRTLWHVTLPMARPGLIGAGLIVFTLTLTDFAIPAMLGGGSQDFIANAIYDQFFRTSDQGLGSALALILVAIGSIFVGVTVAIFGAGTLGMGGRR